jgi:hypothetical protein
MPRKNKKNDDKSTIEKKKGLMNTIVKDVILVENEDIILQLPISANDITKININEETLDIPKPYEPDCYYINESNIYNTIQDNLINVKEDDNNIYYNRQLSDYKEGNIDNLTCGGLYYKEKNDNENIIKSTNNCYWCCHDIKERIYGMPYKYNITSNTYILFGNFCSLECANAYNFSSHCGSDKVWEINSLIQMLSKHYGHTKPIRPAPSRFLLNIFNGPLTIEEFRKGHLTNDKTHLLNLPPMISTTYNYEIVNTSYLKNITDNMNNKIETKKNKK